MMLTMMIEKYSVEIIRYSSNVNDIMKECIKASSRTEFDRSRVGGINALRFLCQEHHKKEISITYIIDELINLESDTTSEFHRPTIHKTFQNISSSKSIGPEVSSCILNMLMESRLVDDSSRNNYDYDDRGRDRSASRILQALLETPKGEKPH